MTDEVYEGLADALDRLPNGFPRTPSGVEIPMLKKMYRPEEAWLAARLGCAQQTTGDHCALCDQTGGKGD